MERQGERPWERQWEAGRWEGQLPRDHPPPQAWGPRWPIFGPALPRSLADEDRNRLATQP